ncbi:glycosyltransferase family 2 protein [Aquirufa antheringensis]|uniref:glycosyltransferase family 2 protein n=1 Tax=Aquirufa antheringensis TaxID=2516559 RepID=UPI0022A94628|nr:glycosyltransferase family 2 protein [Aquirufa antheringensis]MCZ2489565.1 glycosyltransferase family 2 protein [Aquirufa antheringensis]
MKIAGFTFIRNAVKNDYAIVEAITSILPICDEFVVAVGKSEDETLALIQSIPSDKIKIVETVWDDAKREGGATFALETDKALQAISKDIDWAFYIQGDECVHEADLPVVKAAMEANLADSNVEGLLFHYRHFYGSYQHVAVSRRWYRREIRVVKMHPGVHSYKDAQGFRKDGKKLKVKLIPAYINHYGWVKPPEGLNNKVRNFTQFYHDDAWLAENVPADYQFDYGNAERLFRFEGTHPAVMADRVARSNWPFYFDPVELEKKMTFRRKILQKIEDLTGYRVGEYKNYRML